MKKKYTRNFFFFFFSRGLTQVLRSVAGGQELFENGDPSRPWSDRYRNNAHLVDLCRQPSDSFEPGRSNHLLYYDAASLYPSSGKD
jgi:hypothetical protein